MRYHVSSYFVNSDRSHQKHINKMHLGIRPYLCQVCGQSFGEDHELKSHIRNKHTTECDFQCEHCTYATTNKGTFYSKLQLGANCYQNCHLGR